MQRFFDPVRGASIALAMLAVATGPAYSDSNLLAAGAPGASQPAISIGEKGPLGSTRGGPADPAPPPAEAPAVAGLIASVKGDVQVEETADTWRPVAVMESLEPGRRVRVAPDAEAVVVCFPKGDRYRLPSGSITLIAADGLRGESGAAIEPVSALPERETQALQECRNSVTRVSVMSFRAAPDGAIELQSLSDTAIAGPQPVFRWQSVTDAGSYRVRLEDANNRVIWQAETAQTTLSYPNSAPVLQVGIDYVWSVTTSVKDVPREGVGIFHILDPQQAQNEQAELTAIPQGDEPAVAGVLRAAIQSHYQLCDDAIGTYTQLVAQFPTSAPLHLALAELLGAQDRPAASRNEQLLAVRGAGAGSG